MFHSIAKWAKEASRILAGTTAEQRTTALLAQINVTEMDIQSILRANRLDLERSREDGLDEIRQGILTLTESDLRNLPDIMHTMAQRRDLLGQQICENHIEEGLHLRRCMVPLGVIALLYEARPSVAWEAFALCLRNANALILRCSPWEENTARAVTEILRRNLKNCGLPEDGVILAAGGSHQDTYDLFRMERFVDLGIVRGGYAAIEAMKRESTVPLAICGPGNCHIFIDDSADYEMVEQIVINSKADRPLACNAAETLLIHAAWAERNLAKLAGALTERGIILAGDEQAQTIVSMEAAGEGDWEQEFFGPRLAVAIVADVKIAITHINGYCSPHTECIITETAEHAQLFFRDVDSNAVIHNASTRLIDGGVFGFGTEMGISTRKLSWCGPISSRQMVQERFFLEGHGNLRR